MKVLLVIIFDEGYYNGKKYPFDLLSDKFKENGDQLDWFLLPEVSKFERAYDLNSYHALILDNVRQQRIPDSLIRPFMNKNKKILSFKFSTTVEQFAMGDYINYAIPGPYFEEQFASGPRKFSAPIFCGYQIPKPNPLSLNDFRTKYNLTNNLTNGKTVILLSGGFDKLVGLNQRVVKNPQMNQKDKTYWQRIDWLLKNIKTLKTYLENAGYQLIIKNHARTDHLFNKQMDPNLFNQLNSITKINNEDCYEALKYSDFAISFGTTMVYETYFYDLPVLELGTGRYLWRWSKYKTSPTTDQYYQKYQDGADLIFGHLCTDQEFKNLEQTIQNFGQNLPKIEQFKFRDDHPLFGQTYHNTVEKMHQLIIKTIKN